MSTALSEEKRRVAEVEEKNFQLLRRIAELEAKAVAPADNLQEKAAKQRYDVLRVKYDSLKKEFDISVKNHRDKVDELKEKCHQIELRAVKAESQLLVLTGPDASKAQKSQVPASAPAAGNR